MRKTCPSFYIIHNSYTLCFYLFEDEELLCVVKLWSTEEVVCGLVDLPVSLPCTAVVITRSDDIAIGLSPSSFSTNHLLGFEITFVTCSLVLSTELENPSEYSSFCSLAKTMRETVAARRPVGQSRRFVMIMGKTKNKTEPNVLSTSSSDFRGALPTNTPKTSNPATDNAVRGNRRTVCIFVNHAKILVSISGGPCKLKGVGAIFAILLEQ